MHPSTPELLAQARELNRKSKCDEVTTRLTDTVLVAHDNADLYEEAGKAYADIGDKDNAIESYTRAIAKNEKQVTAYANRAYSLYLSGKKEDAWNDINHAISLDSKNTTALRTRGIMWAWDGNFEKAINDAEASISIDPNDYLNFNFRGNIYQIMKRYDEAAADADTAILLNPDNYILYYNKARALQDKGMYDDAITFFDKTLSLYPDDILTYIDRGITWEAKGEPEKALQDYTYVIDKNAKEIFPYQSRGWLYYNQEKYDDALQDFNKALEINPNDTWTQEWAARTKVKMGETITLADILTDNSFKLFKTILHNVPDENEILRLAVNIIDDCIEKIQAYAANQTVEKVAHYTKLKIADILVSNDIAKLRYSNGIYMNDPEEGEVLLLSMAESIKNAYDAGKVGEDSNIYIGSFLDAKDHNDELVMWRTYGKDEAGTEAAGCSIIIHTNFFDKNRSRFNPEMTRANIIAGSESNATQTQAITPQPLYRVLYYDKRKGEFTNHDKDDLKILVTALEQKLSELILMKNDPEGNDTDKDKAINKIVYHIVSEIRYLFKSADYAFENEYRVLHYAPHTSDKILLDKESTPKRLFVESNNPVLPHIDEIFIGAKVPRPEQWVYIDYLLKKKDKKKRLTRSTCKFQ